jgi:large subunit ribosomal protein L24e
MAMLTLQVDSTLAFAAKRNVPIRYDRELMQKTIHAMGRVEEIRAKREHMFYKIRMAGNRKRSLEQDRKIVAENQHLLPPRERDVPPMTKEMDLAEDMDQDMDDGMWEGLSDDDSRIRSRHALAVDGSTSLE